MQYHIIIPAYIVAVPNEEPPAEALAIVRQKIADRLTHYFEGWDIQDEFDPINPDWPQDWSVACYLNEGEPMLVLREEV